MIVLKTIRRLLKLQGSTTMAQVASFGGVSRDHVLNTLFVNHKFITMEGQKIKSVDVRGQNINRLWSQGKLYRLDLLKNSLAARYRGGELRVLKFQNRELRDRLSEDVPVEIPDASGLNYGISRFGTHRHVLATQANIQELERQGLRAIESVKPDDSEWVEVLQ